MTVASEQERVLEGVPRDLLVAGEWRPARAGRRFGVTDPATEAELATVADGDPEDALDALAAAADAQDLWSRVAPRERGELLRRAYELMVARIDDVALVMTLENGKTLAESRGEVGYAAEFFRWFSEEAVRIEGRYTVAPGGGNRLLVTKQPVGPSLLITPWNFPAAMITRKVGAALAAACTTIIKPARATPLTALLIAKLLVESGAPPGVVNVVTTSHANDVTAPLLRDPRLRKLSFTGSTEVGRTLLHGAADRVLRTSMELGGNAPFIVFDDADVAEAVEGAMVAKMRNAGEACTSANRFYVSKRVVDEFSRLLAERMSGLRVGRGSDAATQLGPLIDEAAVAKVEELVDDMVARGGRVAVGGRRIAGRGHFYPATVVTGVSPESRAMREEIFGPVAPIVAFESEQEALELANATEFGLVSYVYTRDLARALRVSERLESGMVGLNTGLVSNPAAPFGGVKESGLGREGGREGIDEYLEVKYVAVALPDA